MSKLPSLPHRIVLPALLMAGCGSCSGNGPVLTPAASTTQLPFQTHILIGESPQALLAWTQADTQERQANEGMLEGVVYGERAFVRLVVTGFESQADAAFQIDGHLRLLNPAGALVHEQAVSAGPDEIVRDAEGVLVLMPGMDILFDPGDSTGAYQVHGTIRQDGVSQELSIPLVVSDGGVLNGQTTP